MPSVTLVRHGQSEANATENHAIYDPGITDLGRKQAAQIHGHFNLVIISTLRRTKETLEHSQVKIKLISSYIHVEEPILLKNQ